MHHRPIVIAHRGASGYLPEHTAPAKALAYGQGADYLEQDVVATRDGHLIVFHDLYLDRMTDVATRFSGRARPDGLHYCIDFSLTELRSLRVTERRRKGHADARFPGRFPAGRGAFGISTLEEELDLIQGLNRATGRDVGIYAEIKEPAWHRQQGVDLARKLVDELASFGYRNGDSRYFIQCFDAAELGRVHRELDSGAALIQLLDARSLDDEQLGAIAGYARGIGPDLAAPLADEQSPGASLLARARRKGLLVHPYTFRADELPPGFDSFDELLARFLDVLGVDGLFTDFPDRVVGYLQRTRGR